MPPSLAPNPEQDLQVRNICGYVAVHPRTTPPAAPAGWLYLRRHSARELFIGNLPRPSWFAAARLDRQTSRDALLQARMKRVVKRVVPGAEAVGDVFGTGNGRLAARVVMRAGEKGVQRVLEAPGDHLYVDWGRLTRGDEAAAAAAAAAAAEGVVERWVREYAEARDERGVRAWSDAAMKAFEGRERGRAEAKARREKEGAEVDEDGFVLVTSGGKQVKAGQVERGGGRRGWYKSKSVRNRRGVAEAGVEKAGFYRWQREGKNVLVDLQRKFGEDKKKVAAIRALEGGGA